jgi:hypothetical protein
MKTKIFKHIETDSCKCEKPDRCWKLVDGGKRGWVKDVYCKECEKLISLY